MGCDTGACSSVYILPIAQLTAMSDSRLASNPGDALPAFPKINDSFGLLVFERVVKRFSESRFDSDKIASCPVVNRFRAFQVPCESGGPRDHVRAECEPRWRSERIDLSYLRCAGRSFRCASSKRFFWSSAFRSRRCSRILPQPANEWLRSNSLLRVGISRTASCWTPWPRCRVTSSCLNLFADLRTGTSRCRSVTARLFPSLLSWHL